MNQHIHCAFLDSIFCGITYLGDGVTVLIVILFFLWKRKYNLALAIVIAYLTSGLLAQLIKHLVEAPRPAAILKDSGIIKLVEGVTFHMKNSFPSGHTTTAYAIAIVLVAYTTRYKNIIALILFILATLVAYSRIYLGQHFPLDILAGAILGTACGVFAVFLMFNKNLRREKEPAINQDLAMNM
jgi:membrane-associated phospholipid phosphatase